MDLELGAASLFFLSTLMTCYMTLGKSLPLYLSSLFFVCVSLLYLNCKLFRVKTDVPLILGLCYTLSPIFGSWQVVSYGNNSELEKPFVNIKNEHIPLSEFLYSVLPKQTALKLEVCLPWAHQPGKAIWPGGVEAVRMKQPKQNKGWKTKD